MAAPMVSKDDTVSSHDLEKDDAKADGVHVGIEEAAPDIVLEETYGKYGKFLKKLFDIGVEARGIERVPEDQRTKAHWWDNIMLWTSLQTPFGGIASGMLGTEVFGLTFGHTVAVMMIMTFIGGLTTIFLAPFGPKLGLRTMVITRFSGGLPGCFIYSVLNILTQVGYSVTNAILAGQALTAINSKVPLSAGIIITTVIAMLVALFGYNMLHHWERFSWIPNVLIWLFVLGLARKGGYDASGSAVTQATGRALIGDVLSFAGIMFSVGSSWVSLSCDYNVNYPADSNVAMLRLMTFIGEFIPGTFVNLIGAALITLTNPDYVAAHDNGGVGGLVAKILSPWGAFGKICVVWFCLTAIAVNVPNTYSAALSIQALWAPLMKVPRFVWTILVTALYLAGALGGRTSFAAILSNLLALLSYWTAFFVTPLFMELFWFRRANGPLGPINPDYYNQASKLPPGIAGVLAICFGVVGSVLGMAETYYVGPIAKAITSPYGGDIGFELSASFSGLAYIILRNWEINHFGR